MSLIFMFLGTITIIQPIFRYSEHLTYCMRFQKSSQSLCNAGHKPLPKPLSCLTDETSTYPPSPMPIEKYYWWRTLIQNPCCCIVPLYSFFGTMAEWRKIDDISVGPVKNFEENFWVHKACVKHLARSGIEFIYSSLFHTSFLSPQWGRTGGVCCSVLSGILTTALWGRVLQSTCGWPQVTQQTNMAE